jgi:hypothetical protein
MKKLNFFVVALLLVSSSLFAKPNRQDNSGIISKYYEELSYEKTDFEPTGAVCERVAVREMEAYYPKTQFTIVNGVQYDEKNITIGELDLVIFDKNSENVEAVAEVKCWRSFGGGAKKAKEQRMRFLQHLDRNIVIYDKDTKKRYSKNQFKQIKKYFAISQQGGVGQGFDYELSLDLKELMLLRSQLLDCRAAGRCPRR